MKIGRRRAPHGSTLAERLSFWSSPTPHGCRAWNGRTNGKGYGSLVYERRFIYAHRAAYEVAFGPIPFGLCVCHRCDNPGCIEPSHFFLGTKAENNADMKAKDRHALGIRNGNAKLTEDGALAIFSDKRRQCAIAREYRVSRALVCLIKGRKLWGHLHERNAA